MSVYYVTAWKTGDIGGGMNEHIRHLPEDAWVCVRDGDSMFLTTDWGKQLETVVEKHGKDYGLIGCMTNRLGGLHQCYKGEFSNNFSIKHHMKIAEHLRGVRYDEVEDLGKLGVAGLFMLFPKRVWLEVDGFVEESPKADTFFNHALRAKGYRLGIARGVYVFHSYRPGEKDHKKAMNNFVHLSL